MATWWCIGTQPTLQQRFYKPIRRILGIFNHINSSDLIFAMIYNNFVKVESCFK